MACLRVVALLEKRERVLDFILYTHTTLPGEKGYINMTGRSTIKGALSAAAVLLVIQFQTAWQSRTLFEAQPDNILQLLEDMNHGQGRIGRSNKKRDTLAKRGSKRKRPFNPFEDIVLTNISVEEAPYSSYSCVATGTRHPDWQSDADTTHGMHHNTTRRANYMNRSCRYQNLYYRPWDKTFHYFASPTEMEARIKAYLAGNASGNEIVSRMQVTLKLSNDLEVLDEHVVQKYRYEPWTPQWRGGNSTTKQNKRRNKFRHQGDKWWLTSVSTTQSNAVFLLYKTFSSHQLGHFVWDDLLALFSLLDLFGLTSQEHDHVDDDEQHQQQSYQPIPFFVENVPLDKWDKRIARRIGIGGRDLEYRCSPWNFRTWKACRQVYAKYFAPLFGIATKEDGDILRTGNWHRNFDNTTGNATTHITAPTEYILLPTVLAGTGRLNFFGCEGECSLGRGPQFWRFRNFLWNNLFPHESKATTQPPPKGYITFALPMGTSRETRVCKFKREIAWAMATYGERAVRVVDMSSLDIHDQAKLMRDTAVLFTNHGGGGVTSMFLPRGAAAFVYWHKDRRFEHNYYESQGYFRPVWVSVGERPFLERTTALLAMEVEKTARVWPNILELYKTGSVTV